MWFSAVHVARVPALGPCSSMPGLRGLETAAAGWEVRGTLEAQRTGKLEKGIALPKQIRRPPFTMITSADIFNKREGFTSARSTPAPPAPLTCTCVRPLFVSALVNCGAGARD